MRWEELTAPDFEKAVRQTKGVCLVAIGCLEKHFDHLPLGSDFLNGHKICCLAAEKEPAVVFPHYYFGQIHEARCFPGTIAMPPVLTLELLFSLCEEIARNGFHKIILYNSHGGNNSMLEYLCQCMLSKRRPYAVFLVHPWYAGAHRKEFDALLDTPLHGHACECETSISLANHPELIKMENLRGRKADPLGRFSHIPPSSITGGWYSDYPNHYAGDATAASAEKGERLRQILVDALAEYVQAVKKDKAVLRVLNEFHQRCARVGRAEQEQRTLRPRRKR